MCELLDQHERSFCDCDQCKAVCHSKPGELAPGDIDRISGFLGVEVTPEFISKNFRAADGINTVRKGEEVSIPTIVPAQRPNGDCVFFAQGKCTIHPVSPFGCSRFNACNTTHEGIAESEEKVLAAAMACANSVDYVLTWGHLYQRGLNAPPLAERGEALVREL